MAGISRSGDAAPVWISDSAGNVLGTAANPLQIAGGTGGGGGSGGAVTIADGADVAEGATTATAYSDATGAASGTTVGVLKGLYVALRTAAQTIVGNVASGAADSGNPVKIGVRYNATLPTVTDGQRADAQADSRGAMYVVLKAKDGANTQDVGTTTADASSVNLVGALTRSYNLVFNGTTWDRQRGDLFGIYTTQRPTAGTNLSGSATTTSGGFNIPANTARHPGDVQGQNVSTVNIGFNEFGGTAAIGSAGTYTVPPGGTFVITTTAQVNFIAASGTAAITVTSV